MKKLHERYKKQDFDARLQMEAEAQRNIDARLRAIEMMYLNQSRSGRPVRQNQPKQDHPRQ